MNDTIPDTTPTARTPSGDGGQIVSAPPPPDALPSPVTSSAPLLSASKRPPYALFVAIGVFLVITVVGVVFMMSRSNLSGDVPASSRFLEQREGRISGGETMESFDSVQDLNVAIDQLEEDIRSVDQDADQINQDLLGL